jgi:hypothetical protein
LVLVVPELQHQVLVEVEDILPHYVLVLMKLFRIELLVVLLLALVEVGEVLLLLLVLLGQELQLVPSIWVVD